MTSSRTTSPIAPRPSAPSRRRLTRRRVLVETGTGLAAAIAGGLAGSAAAQDATPAATPGTPAATPSVDLAVAGHVTPEFAALAVERIPALAQEILAKTGVPGMAVAVVYQDTVTYLGGFGDREIG